MVVGPLLIIGLVIAAIFFKDEIRDFLTLGFQSASEDAQAAVSDAGKAVHDAGKSAGAVVGEAILPLAIAAKEAEILKQAKQAGFDSIADFEMATDTCTIVIGSPRTTCDVGLIGVDDTKLKDRFGGKSNVGTANIGTAFPNVAFALTPVIQAPQIVGPVKPTSSTFEISAARRRRGR